MHIEKIPVNDLVSPDWNPRQITTEELEKLKKSLEEFGYIEPIIVNDVNNHIVGGNQRAKALKMLGYEEVDCVYVHITDINKEKACNVALNNINGDWNKDKLRVVLEDIELSQIDIKLTGFDELELTELEVKEPINIHEDDFIIKDEEDIKINVKEDDLYKLGEHYLLCGNSSNEANVKKLMNGAKADMVFTDPPYDFDKDLIKNILTNTKPNAEIFIMHNEKQLAKLIVKYEKYFKRLFTVNFIIPHLVNNNVPMTQTDYIAHFRKESPTKFNNLKDKFTTLLEISKNSKKDKNNYNHKHAKKVELPSEFIQHFTNKNEKVLDLFGGSGSTLIACEQLNRNCYMIELDPYYCQVIINRWEEFTGEKATLIN